MRWVLQRKSYSGISVYFSVWGGRGGGGENRKLVSPIESRISSQTPWAKILYLSTTSTAGDFACSLYFQDLWDGGGRVQVSLALVSKSDTPCATEKGQEKSQHLGQDLVPTKQLPSTFIGYGWHQRNTWETLWYSHSCASLGKKKNTTGGFPFSSRLPQRFVFLFGNKWNWKVSRCFATTTQSFPTSDPSTACKVAAPNRPARTSGLPPEVTFPTKLLRNLGAVFSCCISKRLLEISC